MFTCSSQLTGWNGYAGPLEAHVNILLVTVAHNTLRQHEFCYKPLNRMLTERVKKSHVGDLRCVLDGFI